ncbi:hypothetical protein SORBI_3005G065400 [Sorghum bicolor]|uniref:DUF1618 domain-containing protein n=1 Tax=Sorghum bicolor TaxID=4558 RepID=A0A1B6PQJ1_SORBI|nr:hypothetical protein SORBI_3005G065400 [Sorghum bicolor]
MRPPTTTEEDDYDAPGGGHRRRKRRPSASLPERRRRSHRSHSHSWVLLNRAGAQRDDDFRRDDRTTSSSSAMSCTSRGEDISVSFDIVEPPGTSVLTVDCPLASTTTTTSSKSTGSVIAAHRDVVLLEITSHENKHPSDSYVDLFVYQAASCDPDPADPSRRRRRRRRPSLVLLPSAGGPLINPHLKRTKYMGIMSCTSNDDDDSPPSSSSFVVAYLEMSPTINEVRLFRPGSGQWEAFKNLHVHGANGGLDLRWWSTDAVVTYGRRYMILVDYYHGMSSSSSETNPPSPSSPPPRLRYVPLPVDKVGDPVDMEWGGRGSPKACRRVCVTRHGVKFVSIDSQHWSNFGVGHRHVLTWSHRFRITTWSLREHDYTWRRDATMHEQEFWDAVDGGDDRRRRFPVLPHVQPRFPVVDVDNPDVVVFRLEKKPDYRHGDEPKWMIEVDLRKKALLAATAYSKETDGRSGDVETINSARMKSGFRPIPSELPQYLDGGGQACKTRRR